MRGQAIKRQTKQELQPKQNCDLLEILRECFSIFDEQEVGSVGDMICAVQSDSVKAATALTENDVSSGSLLSLENETCAHVKQMTHLIDGTHLEYLKNSVKTFWAEANFENFTGAYKFCKSIIHMGQKYTSFELSPVEGNILAS